MVCAQEAPSSHEAFEPVHVNTQVSPRPGSAKKGVMIICIVNAKKYW